MNLHEELKRYLAIRRSLGFSLRTTEPILRRFVSFVEEQGSEHITTDLFVGWRSVFGRANRDTWAHRLGMIRIFAQWLNGIDSRNEVPPRGLIPDRSQRPCPYIYSELEIRRILEAAAELPSCNGLRALTYVTLFGLIAVTGLRVSEAVALDNDDVDLTQGVLTIRRGKLGKARLIPVSESTLAQLAAYVAKRDRILGVRPQPFFTLELGIRPQEDTARRNFATVSRKIGLRSPQKFKRRGVGPRIHDLRHTFAVRTLMNWYRADMDPGQEMLKLCTYLGHLGPESTYWYIEDIPELMELAAKRAERSLNQESVQ
jgi:integrase/recombinase XerD